MTLGIKYAVLLKRDGKWNVLYFRDSFGDIETMIYDTREEASSAAYKNDICFIKGKCELRKIQIRLLS